MFAPRFHGALSSALHFLLVSCGLRHLPLVLAVLPLVAVWLAGWWLVWLAVAGGQWGAAVLFGFVWLAVPVAVLR